MPTSRTDSSVAWRAVAEAAGVRTGTTLLDVGCGTGGFCALAADRGAAAHGLDADAGRIAQARAGAPGVDFRVGLMEALPWRDDNFDVVSGFNAFQYALDVDLALAEARRVARPGGRIAICKWAPPRHNELFTLLSAFRGEDVTPAGADPLHEAVRRAGMRTETTGEVPVVVELRDDAALEAALAAAGALDREPRLADAAAPFRNRDGSYRFTNRFSYRVLRA
jgi:ubiquinone/menaquinone biosynthesis C-methylase UbiE